MWKRMSEEDIKKGQEELERRKKDLKKPLIFSIIIAIVAWVLFAHGFRGSMIEPGSSFGYSIVRQASMVVFVFSLIFYLTYRKQKKTGSFLSSGSRTMLCTECKNTTEDTESHLCECGGQLDPIDNWKWVEEDAAEPEEKETSSSE